MDQQTDIHSYNQWYGKMRVHLLILSTSGTWAVIAVPTTPATGYPAAYTK